jgi:hypothetical protein
VKVGDIVKTGDDRLGRIVKSNGEHFHYLWMLNSTGTRWFMDKFHHAEIVPASDQDVVAYMEMAKEFNRQNLVSPR